MSEGPILPPFMYFSSAVCVWAECVFVYQKYIDVIIKPSYLVHYSVLNMIYCSVIIMITIMIMILLFVNSGQRWHQIEQRIVFIAGQVCLSFFRWQGEAKII